jgi:hypothetical protein
MFTEVKFWASLAAVSVVVIVLVSLGYRLGSGSAAKQIETLQQQVAGNNAAVAAAEDVARKQQAAEDATEIAALNSRNTLAATVLAGYQTENAKLAAKNIAVQKQLEKARANPTSAAALNTAIPAELRNPAN